MKKTKFTISIYTENNVGLLNRISAIFLKRHINIRSITSSESEISNIYRFIIVVKVDNERIVKLVKQIEKQIEVIAAFYHTDEETIFLETALYKVKSKSLFNERQIQNIIKESTIVITLSLIIGPEDLSARKPLKVFLFNAGFPDLKERCLAILN